MIPFNYHHLYYFYTIARLGSVSKAAEELRLGQPTLSSQLKQFETYFKVKFFDREGRKLVLTREGRYLLSYAQDIFDTGREMTEGLGRLSNKRLRPRIRIGASSFIPKAFVDALLKFLLSIDPKIHISVQESSEDKMVEDLKTHLLDLILTDSPPGSALDEVIESHHIGRIPIVFCANPALARKHPAAPQGLNGAPLILPTAHSQVYHSVQEYLNAHRLKPDIVAEIQDVELVRRLALSGVGIAPLNLFTVKNAPSKEPLVVLRNKSRFSIWDNIYLFTQKRRGIHPLIPSIIKRFRVSI
jgi:LysR family transcriptional activator of nhaA